MSRRPREDKQLEAAMRAFLRLSDHDQLRVFQRMGDWLAAGLELPPTVEAELTERAAALEKIREVARALGKPVGVWPTAREFDIACRGTGWSKDRVRKTWGRWLFAIESLNGRRARPTPAQRSLRSRIAGKESGYEDAIGSVRRWLDTDPPDRSKDACLAWVRHENDRTDDGDLLVLTPSAVMDALAIPWSEVIRVAEGVIELADAGRSKEQLNATWSSGPHDFVIKPDIARMLGVSQPVVATRVRRLDFPKPVLVVPKAQAWLREDIEAFAEGRPFVERERNELRCLYFTSDELASLLGVTPAALRQPKASAPERTGSIAGTSIWLRSDVEAWLEEHP
jgi:predicted DNA-binding transcriptional regulator AlpA